MTILSALLGRLRRAWSGKPATQPPPPPILPHNSPIASAHALPEAAGEPILLAVQQSHGSVEHYYHFILGFLAPILLQPPEELAQRQIVKTCGPLDAHIRALGMPQLVIASRAECQAIRASGCRSRSLHGIDDPADFDAAKLQRFREAIFSRLALRDVPQADGVLMIGRGVSPEFYQSPDAEVKTSANLRRSIPNMPAIKEAIERSGRPVRYAELEQEGFAAQVALFASARTVIAQHGAALVNVLWMEPGGTVIEITPKRGEGVFNDVFKKLAEDCGHTYVRVQQSLPHAEVSPEAVLAALATVADVRSHP